MTDLDRVGKEELQHAVKPEQGMTGEPKMQHQTCKEEESATFREIY